MGLLAGIFYFLVHSLRRIFFFWGGGLGCMEQNFFLKGLRLQPSHKSQMVGPLFGGSNYGISILVEFFICGV